MSYAFRIGRIVRQAFQEGVGRYELVQDSDFGNVEQAAGFFDEGEGLYRVNDPANRLQLVALEELRVLDINDGDPV